MTNQEIATKIAELLKKDKAILLEEVKKHLQKTPVSVVRNIGTFR